MSESLENDDLQDPLFKGCTRPAMLFGVPLVPLAVVTGVTVLVSIWTTIFFSVLLILLLLIMRQVAKSDDQQFRLLGLKLRFRILNYNHNKKFWQASVYSPFAFKKRR